MKPTIKKIIFGLIVVVFLIWFFRKDYSVSDSDRPVKKITETTGLYLFGIKRLYSLERTEKLYNAKGLLMQQSFFHDDTCQYIYTYEYNNAGLRVRSLKMHPKIRRAYQMEEYVYDNNHLNTQVLQYEINNVHPDTFLYEKTTYYRDSLKRVYKTTIDHFLEIDSLSFTNVFLDFYNEKNLLVLSACIGTGDTVQTHYYYDANNNRIAQSGGFLSDSIVYTRDAMANVIEERIFEKGIEVATERNWYDENGNEIKKTSRYGNTFTKEYDSKNRLVRERLTGGYFFMLQPYKTYEYEFY